jgi:hypothetical protein
MHLLLGHLKPAVQMFIVGEQLQNGAIRGVNIFGVTAESHPTEWAFTFAE